VLTRFREQDRQAGVGLADLLVSVMLMGLLLTMCVTAVIAASRTTKQVQERTVALAELEQAVQRTARHLRASMQLYSADATSFTSREVRNGTTWVVTIDTPTTTGGARQLRYQGWTCATPCTSPPTGAPTETAIWVRDLRVPTGPHTGGSWFRYSVQSGSTVTPSTPAPTAAQRPLVFSADIALASPSRPGGPLLESTTVVALRNATSSTSST
jgi:Tfp pilus assembly protein PilX